MLRPLRVSEVYCLGTALSGLLETRQLRTLRTRVQDASCQGIGVSVFRDYTSDYRTRSEPHSLARSSQ